MSLFTRSARPITENRNADAVMAAALRAAGIGTDRPVSLTVTPDTAMRHSAVAACVLDIANLSICDPHVHRTDGEGNLVRAKVDAPLLREPSAEVDPMTWRHQVLHAWLTRGTAFGMVAQADGLGYPKQIELLPAEVVRVRPDRPSALTSWTWKVDGQEVQPWPHGPLWIAPGIHTKTGCPVGISPIEMALGAIRLGLAAEDCAASWFFDGAIPAAVLQSDQVLQGDTATAIKRRFLAALNGRREPVVLGAGLKYQQIQVAANESQFLETLEKNVATVARFFLMQPEEIGGSSGSSMTYANVEARQIDKRTRTYAPWIAHFEQVLNVCTPRPQVVRLDESQLMRLDMKTRALVDASDLKNGIRSREEIRRERSLGPPVEGDHFVWPPAGGGPSLDEKPADPDDPDGGRAR